TGPADGVRVVGSFRAVRIEGDSSVVSAIAEGPFRLRRDGGMMVFEEEVSDDDSESYLMFGPRQRVRVRGKLNGRRVHWNAGGERPELRLRMNPNLPLFLDLTAGSAKVSGIQGPITAEITAGSAKIVGVHSPLNLAIEAGSAKISGLFDSGESKIRCSAGSVRVELDPESDVKISASATLGKVALPDGSEGDEGWFFGGGSRHLTLGEGKGLLDIDTNAGAVSVSVGKGLL
ncbi:MAG TPA: hypothetical protein VND22_01285, partial [Actinomycetota bacterium]|nr:hypothetical protein [Actinomycetota bacterium]